jgi:hypothetical protein
MASLANVSYGAPGTYVVENASSDLQISIIPFSSAYMFVECDDDVSINPAVGLPYNTPIQITSLEDYKERLGGTVPAAGPALVSYNSVKGFFRNAGSVPFFVIRVKPAPGTKITLAQPMAKEVQDTNGDFETVYAYEITLNGFPLGRVDYDELGQQEHIGVVVDAGSTLEGAANRIIDEILQDGPISSFVYVRYEEGSSEIELYPRQVDQPLLVEIASDLVLGDLHGGAVSPILASDDAGNDFPTIAPKDYVYSFDNSLDPSIHRPGWLMAPAAFAKYNPADRQIVGMGLENLARREYYNWFALIDAGPRDGRMIAEQYQLEMFRIEEGVYTADPDPTQNKPVFVYETQDFYEPAYNNSGLPMTTTAMSAIDLPVDFANVSVPRAGVQLDAGRLITHEGQLYGVVADYTPLSTPLDVAALVTGGTLVGPLKTLVENTPGTPAVASTLVLPVNGALADLEAYSFDVTINDVTRTIADTFTVAPTQSELMVSIAGRLLANFGDNPVTIEDSAGDILVTQPLGGGFANASITNTGVDTPGVITNGSLAADFEYLFQGQIVLNGGALNWVKRSFMPTSTLFTPTQQRLNLDVDIPISYYELWIEKNLRAGNIKRSVYIPGMLSAQSREVPWNCKTHADFMRDGLMYTSPAGYASYEFPYWVDFEGYDVPASAFRAGIGLKIYRSEGFQRPPAGAQFPIAGVTKPNVEITRQHQEASNPLGLNAGRYLPDYGPVFWSASTVSRRQQGTLWKWMNTAIIRSVIVNSFQGAFDSIIFEEIDTADDVFRRIRSGGEDIMYRLWRGGALYGSSPDRAYRVICSRDNNPDFDLEEGDIGVDVHYIPVMTLERVTVSIKRRKIGSLASDRSIFDVSFG